MLWGVGEARGLHLESLGGGEEPELLHGRLGGHPNGRPAMDRGGDEGRRGGRHHERNNHLRAKRGKQAGRLALSPWDSYGGPTKYRLHFLTFKEFILRDP